MDNLTFKWDEETRTTFCFLIDNEKNQFIGVAKCHPDDEPYCSKLIGETISAKRAMIAAIRFYRNDLKHELKLFENFYHSINQSKHFNPKGYETKMLNRKIRRYKLDIQTANEIIHMYQQEISDYIKTKDKQHKLLAKIRQNKESQGEID